MKTTKITDITGKSSYIRIHFGDAVVRIDGEMLVGGFIAQKDTMHWEESHSGSMDEQEKKRIMNEATKEAQKYGFNLFFH